METVIFILDTTRPIHPDEINGREYYFINKEDMDRDICLESFLEFIEQGGFMYGTAYNTVKRIMESRYIPILHLHPQVLLLCLYAHIKCFSIRITKIIVHNFYSVLLMWQTWFST